MWFDEEKAYNSGTFKLGQEVYNTKDINHRFRFHKECSYCDNTGKVFIKGKEFTCPNCNEVIELDWGHDCDEGNCSSCGHGCHHDEDDDM